MIAAYGVFSVYWTGVAVRHQTKVYGKTWHIVPCLILNLVFWPFGIMFAWNWRRRNLP